MMRLSKELNESYSVKLYYITTSFMAQTNAMLIYGYRHSLKKTVIMHYVVALLLYYYFITTLLLYIMYYVCIVKTEMKHNSLICFAFWLLIGCWRQK